MKNYDTVIKKAQALAARSEELGWLLSAPEVMADSRYLRHLTAEYISIQPIITALEAQNTEELSALLLKHENYAEESVAIEIRSTPDVKYAEELFEAYIKYLTNIGAVITNKAKKVKGQTVLLYAESNGAGVYSSLKNETGIHSKGGKTEVLIYPLARADFDFDEKNLRIDVFHSGGAGGQNVNKVETAIRATHLPTGLVAVCQDERSQLKNKQRALSALENKVRNYYNINAAKSTAEAKAAAQRIVGKGTVIKSELV